MDKILQGIAASQHPENVKRVLFQKFVASSKQQVSPAICHSILTVSAEWILQGESDFLQEMGNLVFQAWARHNLTIFEDFFHHSYLVNVMSGAILNPRPTVEFIHSCVKLLRDPTSVCKVIQTRAISLARECPELDVCAALCRLMVEFPDCVPVGDFAVVYCVTLIQAVSNVEFPNNEAALKNRFKDVNAVGALLFKLWHADINIILPCLQEIFKILTEIKTDSQTQKEPSVALGCLAQHVPVEMIALVTKNAASDQSVLDANMTVALTRMIDWLSWPAVKNIDRWIIAFLRSLASVQKFTILINVTVATVEKVFSRICYPIARNSALAVLTHMLLSFQHSPEAFHKVVNHVPDLVAHLKKEDSVSSRDCLSRTSELFYVLIHHHAGYPDLYEPILDVFKEYPRPSEEIIRQKLQLNAWTSQGKSLFTYHPKFGPKSETGKTGLVNLGNTCYMNSVIQALFMGDGFRRELLTYSGKVQQRLAPSLQKVFAFLAHTQRPAYSPTELLKVAKPPWFATGAQQDCSEFLKHLLDRLSEEDKENIHFEEKLSRAKERLQKVKNNKSGGGGQSECSGDQVVPEMIEPSEKKDMDAVVPCYSESPSHDAMVPSHDNGATGDSQNKVRTIVERYFCGKSVTMTECFNCKFESTREESFTDLPLAFPEKAKANGNGHPDNNCMKGGRDDGAGPKEGKGGDKETDDAQMESVSVECDKTMESESIAKDEVKTSEHKEKAKLEELIDHFLAPEILEGENKYYCEKCQSLQNAVRYLEIKHPPQFLILTLLRFSYDVKLHTRSKLLTDVKYPRLLRLPLRGSQSSKLDLVSRLRADEGADAMSQSPSMKRRCHSSQDGKDMSDCYDREYRTYALTSAIVHSGTSSESGHYYCYGRHTTPVNLHVDEDSGDTDYLPDQWYLFNDSRVSYSCFKSFSNVTKHFSKDTAYVLFYKRIFDGPDSYTGLEATESDPPLNRELLSEVTKDNQFYLQEQELEARTMHLRTARANIGATYRPRRFDDDDDENQGPPGSCGGAGPGGFNVPSNRFIF
ncbi:ubiquitin carboxyl-terminal hydrolase 38-like [Ptychodera flava]|uniref:ubiquitin carboxyl-terminal hydrolase 38-like n=1 Tax=Ptychodera flava TaxID=63121 RepID=UPI003969C7B0